MKTRVYLFLSFLSVCFFSLVPASAQDLTGIWRGSFYSADGFQYKLEFQVKQDKSKMMTGVSYSYLSTVFYGKATMTGSFSTSQKTMQISEIRTVEVRMSGGSATCIMKYNLTYVKSGKEEFLEGTYTSKYEKSDPEAGIIKGQSCGPGKVFLRKVTTSDFYVEPFLKKSIANKPEPKINVPPSKDKPTTTTTTPKKPATQNKKPVVQTKKPAPQIKKQAPVVVKADTTKKVIAPVVIDKPKTPEKKVVNVPAILKSRENSLAQTITVNTNEVTIKLYDNGEIDDDSISVYVDKQLVLSHKRLSTTPITWTLKMDDDNNEHEVVMVAENMGRIPPNTSLMIINAGDKRYQVQITSTEQKNAMVRFRYQK